MCSEGGYEKSLLGRTIEGKRTEGTRAEVVDGCAGASSMAVPFVASAPSSVIE